MKLIKITSTQHSNILNVRWSPNNVCNFHCQYCFSGSNEGSFTSPRDLGLIVKNFRHFFDQYNQKLDKNKFHLVIAGGEPTLWKDLGKFIKEIKQNHDVYISVISNGSRTLRWWKKYGPFIDNPVLSFHTLNADIDHHIQVADTMFEFGKKTTVLVPMDPTCWDKCVNAIEHMKQTSRYSWFIQAKEVINFGKYTEDQKRYLSQEMKRIPSAAWILKNLNLVFNGSIKWIESLAKFDNNLILPATTQTYVNKEWNYFKGWKCDIGLESVYISWDGRIIGSCGQTIYGVDHSFNILDQDFVNCFNPEFNASICSIKKCTCRPETHITKSKF
jgi:Radical SAM superfamily/4Fe-4S single cluster domain